MADVVVIGGGHAGCEAALAASRMGMDTVLLTLNMDGIALMACNPVIGGSAKGHLVRELDALGGEMGRAIDDTFLQSRMLNLSKGPAVHSLRAQADKQAYQNRMRKALMSQERLTVRQGEAASIEVEDGRVCAVTTMTGQRIACQAAVVASGVYLKSCIIIGEHQQEGGPQGLMNATGLSGSLTDLGFELRRFKTGTPARVDVRSIDFDEMTPQPGDEPVVPFSFMTDRELHNTHQCYLTWTTPETHEIIRRNLHRAPLYSGKIHGVGPRYCPSIEDKIVKFADKDRHQVFLEPEGRESQEWYVQGMSTSLPEDVQWEMYRSVPGLRRCQLTRLAYAIEYDCIDSRELRPTLESLCWQGLFFAGQINGTSGYEEAACQGLLAGMNAALQLQGKPPVVITRDMAYMGVMTDDLTTKGTDEPYRMMTSRAEHRLHLRQDNADLRLTHLGYAAGLVAEERMERTRRKQQATAALLDTLKHTRYPSGEGRDAWLVQHGQPVPPTSLSAEELLRRPEITLDHLAEMTPELAGHPAPAREQAQIAIKYAGYLEKQDALIRRARAMEDMLLPEDTDYNSISTLRLEARQKLTRQRPRSLAAASRIPGVSPADVAVLMVWLEKMRNAECGIWLLVLPKAATLNSEFRITERSVYMSSYLLVLLGVVMVSYSGPLVKGGLLAGANPASMAFTRMILAAALLLPLMFIRRRGQSEAPIRSLRRMTRRQWLWSLAASGFLAVHYLTWMTSLDATSTFASVALVCTQPLFVAAVSGLILKEPIPRKALPGAAVALVGAALIGLNSITGMSGDIGGDLLALAGAACMAGHWLCNRYARRTVEAEPFALLLYAQTALLLLLMLPFTGGFRMTGTAWLYTFGLAAGSTLLGHMMFTFALGRVSATVVSFAILGEPVGAMLWSMLMFGEIPTTLLLIGGAVVLVGLTLYLIGSMKQEQA